RMFFFVVVARVLDDAFANFEGEIESAEGGVALLEIFDDAQSMKIVVEEEAVAAHGGVESFFSGVAEGRVADVVNQGEGFGEVDVEVERPGDGAGDWGDFGGGGGAAGGASVNDAVAVALKVVAVGVVRLREAASAGLSDLHRVGGRHGGRIADRCET